jgi:hypothetical protein
LWTQRVHLQSGYHNGSVIQRLNFQSGYHNNGSSAWGKKICFLRFGYFQFTQWKNRLFSSPYYKTLNFWRI